MFLPRVLPTSALVLLVFAASSPADQQAPSAPAGVGAGAAPLTAAEHRELARRAAERLAELQREADELLRQEHSILSELRKLEIERSARNEEIRKLEAESAAVARELEDTRRHLDALERARAESAPALRARLVEVYKLGSGGYVRLLLGVGDLRELARAYRMVSALAAGDEERARAHGSTLAALRQARADLERRQAELAGLLGSTAQARLALDRAVAARTSLVARIDRSRDLNAQLVGELQAARRALDRTVAGLNAGPAAGLPLRPFRGTLDWPAAGVVARRFAGGSGDGAGTGITLAVQPGAPVTAVHDGTVAYAAPFTGFGRLVIVAHGGESFTLYGYLDRIGVQQGARVLRGAPIGRAGETPAGRAGLYFGVRVDGQPVDPLQWLKPR